MRITFVSPPPNMSGGVRVVAIHAEHLRRRGHEVLVASTTPLMPPFRRRVKELLLGHGWRSAPERSPSHVDGFRDLRHRVVERSYITDDDVPDADVVIATWWETAEWIAILSEQKGAKVYLIQGDEAFPGQPADRVRATWDLPFQKVVVSRHLQRLLAERHGDTTAILVPNSVDTSQFFSAHHVKQPDPTVGFAHADLIVKGTDVILRALELIGQRLGDLRIVSFGRFQPAAGLPLPAGARFTLDPPQDRIRDLYGGCDVWLMGSRKEGFGLPILEAMACRTPVVATRAGAAPELIQEGVNGFLVNVEDAEALAEKAIEVLTLSEREWRRMSDAALAAATGYTWDDASGLLEAALQRIVAHGHRTIPT